MSAELPDIHGAHAAFLRELSELRTFNGAPKEFWPRYLSCLAGLTGASKIILVLQDAAKPGSWKKIGDWPANLAPTRFLTGFMTQVEELATKSIGYSGGIIAPL